MVSVPSYDLKVDRAEKHLIDLEFEIRRYTRTHPYRVGKRMEGKREAYRLEFTRQPDEELAVIAGDFLYNIHSALNHLAASIVPSAKRRKVNFPIFWQGVWEPPVEGENKQRAKDRERWDSYTRNMPDGAIAIIKANQPPDLGGNVDNTHALAVVNRLRNTDAHDKLMLVASTLVQPTVWYEDASGTRRGLRDLHRFDPFEGFNHGAEINGIPKDAVNVQIEGTPHVTIRFGQIEGGFAIPEGFRELLLVGTQNMITVLRPFDRRN